jgi:hypothetical protein
MTLAQTPKLIFSTDRTANAPLQPALPQPAPSYEAALYAVGVALW